MKGFTEGKQHKAADIQYPITDNCPSKSKIINLRSKIEPRHSGPEVLGRSTEPESSITQNRRKATLPVNQRSKI